MGRVRQLTVWIRLVLVAAVCGCVFATGLVGQESELRIATYNLRNYLSMDRQVDGVFRRDYPKPEAEKTVVRNSILEVRPDLLVVQEIGSFKYLTELKEDLAGEGLGYDGAFVLEADDDVRMIGALWRKPIQVKAKAHTDLAFQLFGETLKVKRGLLELQVSSDEGYDLSVFALHLKSKYTTDKRDYQASQQRTKEAHAVRERILQLYPNPSEARFLVLGDLNDHRNSSPVRRLLKRGKLQISNVLDLKDSSGLIWTHYYQKGGEYSLIDYMLASPGLESVAGISGGVHSRDDYYQGSDHRLVWIDIEFVRN